MAVPEWLVVVLLLLLSRMTVVDAVCTAASCHHGNCLGGECQCLPLFTGPDCSVPFEVCPDGDRQCFNGSECERNNERNPTTGKYGYRCNCDKAFGVSSYAGIQCEFSATSICEHGRTKSNYAFCTNGGQCTKTILPGQHHPGCTCPEDFEGEHCQYLKGTAPPQDLAPTTPNNNNNNNNDGLSGVATFFIAIITIGVVGLFGFIIWRQRRNTKEDIDADDVVVVEEEGEVVVDPTKDPNHQTEPSSSNKTTPEII
mmetsp:Transcript_19296/g.33068  ORF Transcript_19296/g.33068 Transcript_19296/m.33068 type:complete len:256 (-) Transcript_19296:5-772(-)